MKSISFGLVVIVLTVFLCVDALPNAGCFDCIDCYNYAPGSGRDKCLYYCSQPCLNGKALQTSGCFDCIDCYNYPPGSGSGRDQCLYYCRQPCLNGKSLQTSDKIGHAQADRFCKLGCVTSVCSAITTTSTLRTDENDVKGAVDRCNNGCSKLCTKRFGGSAAVSA